MAMLGIVKMGGIAGPLFSALGPDAVKDRALDCSAKFVITSPYLHQRLEPVLDELVNVEKFIIVGDNTGLGSNTVRFDDVLASGDPNFKAVDMAVMEAISPDNAPYAEAEREGRKVTVRSRSDTCPQMLHTMEDLLACVKVAEETVKATK